MAANPFGAHQAGGHIAGRRERDALALYLSQRIIPVFGGNWRCSSQSLFNFMCGSPGLFPPVPCASSGTVRFEVVGFDQCGEMLFDRVAVRAGQRDDIANRDAAALLREIEDVE